MLFAGISSDETEGGLWSGRELAFELDDEEGFDLRGR
jgi:hypothetical protein